ncbi:MAG TPA: ferrous iron transport protein B [Oscillospiraceae bacterium]|nr:ferrous iron transport protein B [Oscillospiraceae bacterium]
MNLLQAPHTSLHFALAGNPNCGKTTLFNQLTGSSQTVGNWPGVTVEKKEGKVRYQNSSITVVDLPGIYSLSPYSPEEVVARNYMMKECPDVIIDIVDATNLERNLYLTTQLAELQVPVVVALNMLDLVERRGDKIDFALLEKKLGVPIVPISASKGIGIDKLLERAVAAANGSKPIVNPLYSADVEYVIGSIEHLLSRAEPPIKQYQRWTAVKLFEGDKIAQSQFHLKPTDEKKLQTLKQQIHTSKYVDREMIIADQRYRAICSACAQSVKKGTPSGHDSASDKIDRMLTNKWLAIPLFFALMLLIFYITFGPVGSFLTAKVNWLINSWFSGKVTAMLAAVGASDWARSLTVDGVIAGVGAVLAFLPQILLLFFLLSILEDSGYMARAAFIMDQLLRKIGLSGKAFVPMLMGFGCTVPAVMGTRILENDKDKRLTILITPFMSCSAKMPVYSMFILAFFVGSRPLVIFSIYILGIIVAVLSAILFKNTILSGKPAPFVMELPPYRMPTLKSLWLHVWERLKDFLTKAGTVLLGATVIIWFLQSFNPSLQLVTDATQSILASVGRAIAPVFTLCGFGDWRSAVSLVTGLVAKESVVSTMRILYPIGADGSLSMALRQTFTPLSAYSFLIFVLLYTPCVAALSAIRREMGSLKWTAVTVVYQLVIAWFASALFFQVATLITRFL